MIIHKDNLMLLFGHLLICWGAAWDVKFTAWPFRIERDEHLVAIEVGTLGWAITITWVFRDFTGEFVEVV